MDGMSQASTSPRTTTLTEVHPSETLSTPWVTLVWDDPVNLMPYVTHVFTSYFRYPRPRAEQLMLQVHHEGKAVVSSGSREEMERDVEAMHGYGLWATMDRSE